MYNTFTWLPLESEIFILGFNVLFVFSLLYFCNYRVKIEGISYFKNNI